MVLSEANRIDVVAEKPGGEVVLGIVAPESWSDRDRLLGQLTDKLCTYLRFIHSREYRSRFGSSPAAILLLTAEEPPQEVRRLVDATSRAAKLRIDVERVPAVEPITPDHVAATAGPAWPAARLRPRAAPRVPSRDRVRVVRTSFGVLGLFAAVAAAIYAFSLSSSYWLAIYVFVLANYVIARGIADVITDPCKLPRAAYFAFLPVVSTVVLYVAYVGWGKMWIAVILGLVGGAVFHAAVAPYLFPRIHVEEQLDSAERMTEALAKHGKA